MPNVGAEVSVLWLGSVKPGRCCVPIYLTLIWASSYETRTGFSRLNGEEHHNTYLLEGKVENILFPFLTP